MILNGSYEFAEMTQVEGIFVSNGREKASGKLIQVHLFPAAKSVQANLICQRLVSLPDEVRNKILKYGQEGSASYFVTEPLPPGEYLQSWIEKMSSGPKQTVVPEVSFGLTSQLRQMGISPAALAPMMPGPESLPSAGDKLAAQAAAIPPGAGPGEFTRIYSLPPQAPPKSSVSGPPVPGEDTAFGQFYGGEKDPPLPEVMPAHGQQEEPRPAFGTAKSNPGLETFLDLPNARPSQPKPPVDLPVPPNETSPLREPPPMLLQVFEDPWQPPPKRVTFDQSVAQPAIPSPRPASPPLRAFNWKIALVTAGMLLVAGAVVIAVMENGG